MALEYRETAGVSRGKMKLSRKLQEQCDPLGPSHTLWQERERRWGKGRAIFLDKGERSWKEKLVYAGRIEGAVVSLSVVEQRANRVFFRTLLE